MKTLQLIRTGGLGSLLVLGSAVAQEEAPKPKPKAPAIKAMRLTAGGANATAPSQDDLKKRFDAKMAEPFVKNAAWVLDYDAARTKSKESGKRIFAYFTRSYAP